ncbi:MAG: hypothetical protein ACI4I4_06975 [Acutalibacteraceae bacterium]
MSHHKVGKCFLAFGLGLIAATFCPDRVIITIIAAILVILSIALIKC